MCDPVSAHWVAQSYRDYVSFCPQKVSSKINEQHKVRYVYVGSCMVFMLCTVMGLWWLTNLYIIVYMKSVLFQIAVYLNLYV
jgi:hypothetical protein